MVNENNDKLLCGKIGAVFGELLPTSDFQSQIVTIGSRIRVTLSIFLMLNIYRNFSPHLNSFEKR